MSKNVLRLFCAFALLGISGCSMFFPSESFYAGGFAWIGDDLYLYAPMCESERLVGVEVSTEKENPANYDAPFVTRYWHVEDPVDAVTSEGWIVLGDDSQFDRIRGESVAMEQWPQHVFITFSQTDDLDDFTSYIVLERDFEIPEYPVGSDPLTVDYLFEDPSGRSDPGLSSPEEIRDRMGCAKQHF